MKTESKVKLSGHTNEFWDIIVHEGVGCLLAPWIFPAISLVLWELGPREAKDLKAILGTISGNTPD